MGQASGIGVVELHIWNLRIHLCGGSAWAPEGPFCHQTGAWCGTLPSMGWSPAHHYWQVPTSLTVQTRFP